MKKTIDCDMPAWVKPEWERFFSTHYSPRGSKKDIDDLYVTSLFPLQRKAEILRAADKVSKTAPNVIMEIGGDKGGAFYHWVHLIRSVKKAICLEPRGTPHAEMFEENYPDVEFLWIEDYSLSDEAKAKVREFLGEDKIDFLFIDGDKSLFEADFDEYWPLVSDGGITAFHDVFDEKSPMQNAFINKKSIGSSSEVLVDMSDCDKMKSKIVSGTTDPTSGYEDWVRTWLYTSCGYGFIYK